MTSQVVLMFILHACSKCTWYRANVGQVSFCIVCIWLAWQQTRQAAKQSVGWMMPPQGNK
jgi:hypothetical protein